MDYARNSVDDDQDAVNKSTEVKLGRNLREMFLACNSILGGPHDGALIDTIHPSRSPTLQTGVSSTIPLSRMASLLSPMLHTMQPGRGSALIQMPSSPPCSRGNPGTSAPTKPGRLKNTCKADLVGSAYKNLLRLNVMERVLWQFGSGARKATVIPEKLSLQNHVFPLQYMTLTCGRRKRSHRDRRGEVGNLGLCESHTQIMEKRCVPYLSLS